MNTTPTPAALADLRYATILSALAELRRDMVRTETRLCRLAVALGQAHVLQQPEKKS